MSCTQTASCAKTSRRSGSLETEESTLTGDLVLPWPPSVNTYWRTFRGRMILSKFGRLYQTAVAEQVVTQSCPKFGDKNIKVTIAAYRPDKRRRDLDNLPKAVLDGMCSAGVYDDDSQIVDLRIYWADEIGGMLKIKVEAV